ncbi:nuclear transport factor 2 family protein [Sphaerisporangium corydalis]|uniref:Nuclear transport factor 2 family protein n=1 Tax=Sphaerisporangium corydalis TaxID=1441875 RepID=A0ABV9ECJ4_9ACTN|nr:nuclear transport factor 2 family protein [Sphaerisporangium corydalis]
MSETPAPAAPREVFERLIAGISARAWHGLADLYAEDVVIEIPFALPAPTRIEGRDAVRAHFDNGPGADLTIQVRDVVVYETTDPEVIVAEFVYDGRVASTGREFTVPNIQVLRVRDGRIVASRDYHHHVALADAFDRLPQAVEAFTGQGLHKP